MEKKYNYHCSQMTSEYTQKISKTLQKTIRKKSLNSFNKVKGLKINIWKSIAFLYISNELSERETEKTIPFTIASKRIKY